MGNNEIGLQRDEYDLYGRFIAKITREKYRELMNPAAPDGKLVLVTAMSPTPAGEGKTTTSVGLADALVSIGERTLLCLREPSLGARGLPAAVDRAQIDLGVAVALVVPCHREAVAVWSRLIAAAARRTSKSEKKRGGDR